MKSLNCNLLIISFVLLSGLFATAAGQIYFDTAGESKLWLEGSSTVHRFDCVARSIDGTAYLKENGADVTYEASLERAGGADLESARTVSQINGNENVNSGDLVATTAPDESFSDAPELFVQLKIPVRSFDCGRSRMNRDMYEALKSDKYDYITFEFKKASAVTESDSDTDSLDADGFTPFTIEGILNVAGVDQNVSLVVQGRAESDGRYRIKGRKEISMLDFDIDPPTALRGLVRAHEDLTVLFDIVAIEKQP